MSNKTNILFYIPSLPQELGGVRQYAAGLLKLFIGLKEKFNFFIYHDGIDPNIMSIMLENTNLILVKPDLHKLSKIEKVLNEILYYSVKILNKFKKHPLEVNQRTDLDFVVDFFSIDIIHCPYQFLPVISGSAKKNVKRVITMHDVQELHFPEFFTAKERAHRAVNYMNYINSADIVVVSYNHVKKDIIKYFNKEEECISVLLLKMDNLWFKKFEKTKPDLIKDFEHYLFYPSNFWKHKNHKKLIETIHWLKVSKNLIVNLILTGDQNTSEGFVLNNLIEKLDLFDQVKILGIVDERKLYSLYKNARGLVIPTFYEAGSFPLMESILMEIPVICSNVTSLPETIGEEKFIFNPFSLEEMAEKIGMLWTDESYRSQSIENNRRQQLRLIDTNADFVLNSIYSKN